MKNLFFIAQDENADELFATIESDHSNDSYLTQLKDQYENAKIEDKEFCEKVLEYLKPPSMVKKFAVIMCIRDDWDEPNIDFVDAIDEDQARDKYIEEGGDYLVDMEEGEEEGEIFIIIKEVK